MQSPDVRRLESDRHFRRAEPKAEAVMHTKEILRVVELFDGLTDDELSAVVAVCRSRRFNEGDSVAEQNSPGTEMFIIEEGFVEVAVDSNDNNPRKVIVNLGSGQTVGEMSLVDQGPRSATVRAISSPTVVQVISQTDFETLCDRNTRIGYVVMRNIAADLSFRLRQRHMSDKRG
ncbi:MAG: cyclic nucleotide-binding domain-containing protein [Chloroflexi bacterium]|nr:cyclic nucleotide-binding domain-containing protein [Chloroflexota bacterium]